ncbi:MAG: hypothetical protein BME93_05445 [Methanosarcinales archaeon Met12]|nr:MAG: hypothetical protein BME93_05445 [Methanosarcinales archaeon Met12]
MTCELSEYELDILYKIVRKNRWCKKHISQDDIVRGFPSHDIGIYKNAIKSLIKKGLLVCYKSKGRNDVCIPKRNRATIIEIFDAHNFEIWFIR